MAFPSSNWANNRTAGMTANTPSLETPPDNTTFVSQLRPALVKYFKRKTGSAVDAEDLAQDVLVRALTYSNWRTEEQAKGYVFRTAVNRWRDRLRRQRTRGVTVAWNEAVHEYGGEEAREDNSPERGLIAGQELIQVVQTLEKMHVRTRTVLMLIKLEQMRIATVAEMLGISVSAVSKHLSRGIAQLAELRKQQDRS
jgi:RNA polymerase sigma factor (sigma-70 family)